MVWYWVVDSGFCLDRSMASRRKAIIMAAKRAAMNAMRTVRLRFGPDVCAGGMALSITCMVEPAVNSFILAAVRVCMAIW